MIVILTIDGYSCAGVNSHVSTKNAFYLSNPRNLNLIIYKSQTGDEPLTFTALVHKPPSCSESSMPRIGGLPSRLRAVATDGRSVGRATQAAAAASSRAPSAREEFMGLLRRKAWCLDDVEKHPVVLGVPLGMVAGSGKTIAVDVGLKNPATISVAELIKCSPQAKSIMLTHALRGAEMPKIDSVLQQTPPLPMALVTVEDVQKLPIATPMHPSNLERRIPTEDLQVLQDPFFSSGGAPGSTWQSSMQDDPQQQQQRAGLSEFTDLVIDQIPDADEATSSRREWQREQRRLQQIALGITPNSSANQGRSNSNGRREGGGGRDREGVPTAILRRPPTEVDLR